MDRMQKGDRVEFEIPGRGTLRGTIADVPEDFDSGVVSFDDAYLVDGDDGNSYRVSINDQTVRITQVPRQRRELIGRVGVDSAALVITDPSYIGSQRVAEKVEQARRAWAFGQPAAPFTFSVPFEKGHEGAGVAFSSGIGDGFYPVYAVYGEVEGMGERIIRVEVDFLEHPWINSPFEQVLNTLYHLEALRAGPPGFWDEGGAGRAAIEAAELGFGKAEEA